MSNTFGEYSWLQLQHLAELCGEPYQTFGANLPVSAVGANWWTTVLPTIVVRLIAAAVSYEGERASVKELTASHLLA